MDERERWESRHAADDQEKAPDPVVIEACKCVAVGGALDLACGAGRNTLFLARSGWSVVAVDYSSVALEKLRARAVCENLAVEIICADLNEWRLPVSAFDLICNCRYLQRDLFPAVEMALKPGGAFAAFIAMDDDDPSVNPMRADYLLRPGELPTLLPKLRVLHYSEAKSGPGKRRMAEFIAVRDLNDPG